MDKYQPIKNKQMHTYNIRSNMNYYRSNVTKSVSVKNVLYQGIKLFNKLPPEIKAVADLSKQRFELKLKRFLINNCLYSLDEL